MYGTTIIFRNILLHQTLLNSSQRRACDISESSASLKICFWNTNTKMLCSPWKNCQTDHYDKMTLLYLLNFVVHHQMTVATLYKCWRLPLSCQYNDVLVYGISAHFDKSKEEATLFDVLKDFKAASRITRSLAILRNSFLQLTVVGYSTIDQPFQEATDQCNNAFSPIIRPINLKA